MTQQNLPQLRGNSAVAGSTLLEKGRRPEPSRNSPPPGRRARGWVLSGIELGTVLTGERKLSYKKALQELEAACPETQPLLSQRGCEALSLPIYLEDFIDRGMGPPGTSGKMPLPCKGGKRLGNRASPQRAGKPAW